MGVEEIDFRSSFLVKELLGEYPNTLQIGAEMEKQVQQRTQELEDVNEQLQKHRTNLKKMIQERTTELQKAVNLLAGRELRMAELKKVIKKLSGQLEEAGLTPVAHDPLKQVGQENT